MLVYTKSIVEHRVLASTQRGIVNPSAKGSATAIGEMLDKCARDILPEEYIPTSKDAVVYARLMESYCSKEYDINRMMNEDYEAPQNRKDDIRVYQSKKGSWSIPPPLRQSQDMIYNFTGLGGQVRAIMGERPDMPDNERVELAYATMRLAFEHIMSRAIMALQNDAELLANPPQALVISGGVARNHFLRNVAASTLRARGFDNMTVTAPSPALCTDNAPMVAWAGQKMYQAGWTTDLSFLPQREWPIEEIITGVDCWIRNDAVASPEPTSNVAHPRQDIPQLPDKSELQEPPLPSTADAPEEPDAVAAPNTGVANRRGAKAKSITPTEDKAPYIKSQSDGNKPSAEPDPGRPSSQNRRRAPNSKGPRSPRADTRQTPPRQTAKHQPQRSPLTPVKRTKAKAQPPRSRSGTGKSDPVKLLQDAEALLLGPRLGLQGPNETRPVDGRIARLRPDIQPDRRLGRPRNGPRDSLAGMREGPAKKDRLDPEKAAWRREQALGALGHARAAPPPAESIAHIHPGTPEKALGRSSTAGPRVNDRATNTAIRPPGKKKEKRIVRLLPPSPAPADKPGPEGSFRTGLKRLKRWVGL